MDKKKSRRERKKEENSILTLQNTASNEPKSKQNNATDSSNLEFQKDGYQSNVENNTQINNRNNFSNKIGLDNYEKLAIEFEKNLISNRKLPIAKQLEFVTEKVKTENKRTINLNKLIKDEITNITDKLKNSPELSKEEKENLAAKIEKLENQMLENDLVYQKLRKDTNQAIEKLKQQANIQQAFLKRNRNLLRITLFVGLSLTLLSIWLYYISRKRRKQRDYLVNLVNKIEIQKEEIKSQNIQIAKKSDEVESAYTKITDSIRYAQRLQSAVLGDEQQITNLFKESFMVFIPKDVLSGDFYWTTKIDHLKIIVAADCTGHGIPGAMLTMLGNSILNDVIIEECVYSPEQILKALDIKFTETIEKQTTGKKPMDGMDLIVLVLDEITQTVRFSGAVNSLYYVRNNELHQIKASPFPIGITPHKKNKTFILHEFPYQKNDIFYLSSDGFQDQFGGKEHKKYLKVNFREFLLKTSSLPIAEQKEQFLQEFYSWKGNLNQTDDVLVIGLKV